jgi:hypothetical protein
VIPSAKLGLLGQRHGFDRCNRSQSLRSGKNRSENDESQADNAKQAAGGAGYAGPEDVPPAAVDTISEH